MEVETFIRWELLQEVTLPTQFYSAKIIWRIHFIYVPYKTTSVEYNYKFYAYISMKMHFISFRRLQKKYFFSPLKLFKLILKPFKQCTRFIFVIEINLCMDGNAEKSAIRMYDLFASLVILLLTTLYFVLIQNECKFWIDYCEHYWISISKCTITIAISMITWCLNMHEWIKK